MPRLTVSCAVVGLSALLLAGCAAGPTPAATAGSSAHTSTAAQFESAAREATKPVLEAITADAALEKLRGDKFAAINVGSTLVAPPMGFLAQDGKTPTGFEIDLIEAIGKKLGSRVEIANAPFQTLITGLTGRRFDLLISQMNDNSKRQQTIDFVDYYDASIAFIVRKDNPAKISDAKSLCGKSVSALPGSSQLEWANTASPDLCGEGNEIKVVPVGSEQDALNNLRTGRQAASLSDTSLAAFTADNASNGGNFEAILPETQIDPAPYGIGVRKDDSQLRDAVKGALQALIEDGTYKKLAEAWKVEGGSVGAATVNAGH